MDDVSDLANRLNNSGLVIGEHHRNQRRRADRSAACSASRSTMPGFGHRNPRDLFRPQSVRPAPPTDARSPIPAAGRKPPGPRPADQPGDSARALASVPPEVKTTSAGSAPTSARDLPARLLDRPARGAAFGMDGGRVPGKFQGRQHGGARLRPQRRGGIPVEIGTPALGGFHRHFYNRHRTCHPPITGYEKACILPPPS